MSAPVQIPPIVEHLYRRAICLYPFRFRESYGDAMLQSLLDAFADSELPKTVLLPTLIIDLIQSLAKENLAVFRETFSRPALIFNALVLGALSTILFLGLSVIPQQVLRQDADDPQLELTGNLASRLQHGLTPNQAVPGEQVDMDSSLSTFMTVYDEQGNILASSGQLDGKAPAPPPGVFEFVRQHGEERLTWAPRRDVRIASVIRHVPGAKGGFILAGRNLREVESRKDNLLKLALLAWIGMLATVVGGTFLFGWFTRFPKAAIAA